MQAIELVNAGIGTVSSREDGSVALRVITAELRPSEAGLLMSYHGKAARVLIAPHEGAPEEIIHVETERAVKSPGQRLRAVLFVWWKQTGGWKQTGANAPQPHESFEVFYAAQVERYIEHIKGKLDQS